MKERKATRSNNQMFNINFRLNIKREKTNKMQQSDVYYQLPSQHEEREKQQEATIRFLI